MLVNRHDYSLTGGGGFGVGYQLLNTSSFDPDEIDLSTQLLVSRRTNFGDGVVVVDCGANIGVHTVEWSRSMHGWGSVIAIEAQERIYYALAGNIAMNNCFNAKAIFAAIGARPGEILVPVPDYFSPASFGSLELRKSESTEFIGQAVDYSADHCVKVRMISLDELALKRLDFMKIDIEGMEVEALLGAEQSIRAFKPQLLIEKIKSDEREIRSFLEKFDYKLFASGINLLAVHPTDPVCEQIRMT